MCILKVPNSTPWVLPRTCNPDVASKIHTCARRLQDAFAGFVMLHDVWEVPGVEVLGYSSEPLPSNWCIQENICLRKSCCMYLKGNNVVWAYGWAILTKPEELPLSNWVSCLDLGVTANLFEGGKEVELKFWVAESSAYPWMCCQYICISSAL